MFKYEIRHSDYDGFEPVSIERSVMINHYGTILSYEPFELENGNLEIGDEDLIMEDEIRMVIE